MSLKEVKHIWDQLKALRETLPPGVVHEAQVYQLKQWGPLALQHVEEIEIAIKLEVLPEDDKPGSPPEVEFRAKGVTMAVPDNFTDILEGLDRSVKDLLGRHWTTRVSIDGSVIFEKQGRHRPKKDVASTIERLKNADKGASESK